MKPWLLDAFCGAGGCTRGYQQAGFRVVGVDHGPMPNYCGEDFIQADALAALRTLVIDGRWRGYRLTDLVGVHASPPCQAYTSMRHMGKGAGEGAHDLVGATRELLETTGLPYVLENVVGAPLRHPLRLCGSSFGLNVWRHRLFETNFPTMAMACAHHLIPEPIAVYGDHPEDSRGQYRVRRARTLEEGQEAMGIGWMPWKSLTQAIPPAMTEWVGSYLMAEVNRRTKAAA